VTVSKVGRRGQITLPRDVRNWLQIEEGDHVAFLRRGEEIVLHPLIETLLDRRGSLTVRDHQDFDRARREVRKCRAERLAGDNA